MDSVYQEAAQRGFFAYKDPEYRNRYILVKTGQWTPEDLAAEVARPGGMRVGPEFIGNRAQLTGFFSGLDYVAFKAASSERQRE